MGIRVTQAPVEVLAQPTTLVVRVTQAPVEVLAQPTTLVVRVTQTALEVLVLAGAGPAVHPFAYAQFIE